MSTSFPHTARARVLCVGSVAGSAPRSAGADGWLAAAGMTTLRSLHTATMLANGKVLVAGGDDSSGCPTASAEIYDPIAGTWTATGGMTVARTSHTATLLSNGTVLVAGGSGSTAARGSGDQASAEIYDPVAGTWIPTGRMTSPRIYHTATLLAEGAVLVAGGMADSVGIQASAEIYDPVAGKWTAAGRMIVARDYHTATLLPDGTVLLVGGEGGYHVPGTTSAEIYDPAAGTCTATGSMATARYLHTATLLPNGTVLVAGGFNQIGGTAAYFAGAEIYDPAARTWMVTGSMTTPRYCHIATLLPDGTVLVAGGGGPEELSSAEIYDPAAARWTSTGSMITARGNYTATLLPNETVLAAGGENNGGVFLVSSAEIFQP
jgi:Kelch motif/Galactose oxidase, central domain